MRIIYLSILFFIFLPLSAYSKPICALLWLNNRVPDAHLNIDFDSNMSGTYNLTITAGGNSKVVDSYQQEMWGFVTVDGSYRYWIQYKDSWLIDDVSKIAYRVKSNLEVSKDQIPGAKTVLSPITYFTWVNTFGCMSTGDTYEFPYYNLNGIQLELKASWVKPGTYKLDLPIKVAYEENKGFYNSRYPSYPSKMSAFKPIDSSGIMVRVKPKCSILSNELSINMGDSITPQQASQGVNKKLDVSISCNHTATVKWSLRGSQIKDGVQNRTSCGGGYCELKFNNNTGELQTSSPEGTSKQEINVLYKDSNAKEGPFSGSAVLSVEVV
ncbi:nuclease PIN [Escherichia coli]|uniref:nuclease PIN n=1 Tax=Escherichia coli TaxID=562 RepID=UPI0020C7E75F|nr:nuclease PIN [Escherichia coli]MCP8787133.1 nuclease PIN [Escherichia coli]